ncbi:MAG: response regulator [bacterium]
MALRRALVVDDSRSARMALKKLLEEHQLQVDLADSGESAIEFLKKASVDVIFMDHTMPGMDGLEAVSAIKANPRTATIPVMMYTTKEGEVYVGQARALGAVGVLPKNVQPHQLFEMLLNLGLVKERRDSAESREPHTYVLDEVDQSLEQQAQGIAVQNLVTRILEDQHLTLRADILRSQRSFAKEVAHELLKEQALQHADETADVAEDVQPTNSGGGWWLRATLLVGLLVACFLAFQFKMQRDSAVAQLALAEAAQVELMSASRETSAADNAAALEEMAQVRNSALRGFAATLNENTDVPMLAPAFSATLAQRLADVLPFLSEMGFAGDVVVTSHLGRFCLMVDAAGQYQLAPDELPMLSCDYIGHLDENNTYVSDRLSVEFAQLLNAREDESPALVLRALDGASSVEMVPYPDSQSNAGQWNAVARLNNRVEISFQP